MRRCVRAVGMWLDGSAGGGNAKTDRPTVVRSQSGQAVGGQPADIDRIASRMAPPALVYLRRRLCVALAALALVSLVVLPLASGGGDGGERDIGDTGSTSVASQGGLRRSAVPAPSLTAARDLSADAQAALDPIFGDADYAVAVVDLSDGGDIVRIDADRVYSSASTYKLFVAYSMMTAVESGEMTWDSPLNGMSLKACLTTMIVDSDNDCPKAWLMRDNERGYATVTAQARSLGATGTTLHYLDVRTTASDLALILTKLHQGTIGTSADRAMVIDLMKRQVYRSGIPAGVASVCGGDCTVADKVGFRDEYLHDAGIVTTPDGSYAFAIMTSGSSWAAIAKASAALYRLVS